MSYVRRFPDRAPHGSKKAALFALAPGDSFTVTCQRVACIWIGVARVYGLRLTQRACHPYYRANMKSAPSPRKYTLTLAP